MVPADGLKGVLGHAAEGPSPTYTPTLAPASSPHCAHHSTPACDATTSRAEAGEEKTCQEGPWSPPGTPEPRTPAQWHYTPLLARTDAGKRSDLLFLGLVKTQRCQLSVQTLHPQQAIWGRKKEGRLSRPS